MFDSLEDLEKRIDDPNLNVTPQTVMVLRNAGPIGAPGMPEAGALPIPKKLGSKGLKDMVRLSDARMSGTAFGTVVLHVSPEAAAGGPLALVRDGDRIELDTKGRKLNLKVDDAELAKRRAQWKPPQKPARGYIRLYTERVTQAEHGCDFDFLANTPASVRRRDCATFSPRAIAALGCRMDVANSSLARRRGRSPFARARSNACGA